MTEASGIKVIFQRGPVLAPGREPSLLHRHDHTLPARPGTVDPAIAAIEAQLAADNPGVAIRIDPTGEGYEVSANAVDLDVRFQLIGPRHACQAEIQTMLDRIVTTGAAQALMAGNPGVSAAVSRGRGIYEATIEGSGGLRQLTLPAPSRLSANDLAAALSMQTEASTDTHSSA